MDTSTAVVESNTSIVEQLIWAEDAQERWTEIGAAGAEMGPNFAKDHVHPSDAGHAIIAHHVTLALALLAAEARP